MLSSQSEARRAWRSVFCVTKADEPNVFPSASAFGRQRRLNLLKMTIQEKKGGTKNTLTEVRVWVRKTLVWYPF
jgi:hypothetical protein